MHPEVKSNKAGKCPECGMQLARSGSSSNRKAKKHERTFLHLPLSKKVDRARDYIFSHKLTSTATALFLISLIWFSWVVWIKLIPHEEPKVHYHAGFIVIKDNQQIDFSDIKYMKIEPCSEEKGGGQEKSPQHIQQEKAHLHGNVGDVVHVESNEALWRDLFLNIQYSINYQETIAFIDGKQINNFQNQPIEPYQSLVLFQGTASETQRFLNQAVTKEHIKEEEVKSEDCGSD